MGHEHPFGRAVWYAIVLLAITHLALSLFYGIFHGNLNFANMFHVLGIDLIWPALGKGPLNALFGVVMVVVTWAIVATLLYRIEQKNITPVDKKPATKKTQKEGKREE